VNRVTSDGFGIADPPAGIRHLYALLKIAPQSLRSVAPA
jgi:hypothetical protein